MTTRFTSDESTPTYRLHVRVTRFFVLISGFALVACSATGGAPVSSEPAPVEETITSTGVTVPDNAGATPSGRPLAPDFTLELGDGGSYSLSEADKPVYLVFWAEWCPTCRRELPIVDALASEYSAEVDFVAPAWKSTMAATQRRAEEIFRSGVIKWGLDAEEQIFALYGVPYQPVTVLIAEDGTVVESWDGLRAEQEIRSALDALVALSS